MGRNHSWKKISFVLFFLGVPIALVALGVAAVRLDWIHLYGAAIDGMRETGLAGFIIGLGVGIVFQLIAFFAFIDRYLLSEEPEGVFSGLAKWFSVSTSLLLFLTLSGWYLCSSPRLAGQGMIFTHPTMIGRIYRYVEQGPMFEDRYDEKVLAGFHDRVRSISAGIFLPAEVPGQETATGKSGATVNEDCPDREGLIMAITSMPFFIAFGFSIVGAVIWALMDTLRQIKQEEEDKTAALLPRHYLSYLLRCVSAPFVAVVVACFLASDWPVYAAPALFFCIGFFPKQGIEAITGLGRKLMAAMEQDAPNQSRGKDAPGTGNTAPGVP